MNVCSPTDTIVSFQRELQRARHIVHASPRHDAANLTANSGNPGFGEGKRDP